MSAAVGRAIKDTSPPTESSSDDPNSGSTSNSGVSRSWRLRLHLPSVSASSLAWYVDRHGAERTSARSTTWWFCLWMLERRCDVGLSLQDLTAKCARMRFPLIKDARARTTSACVRRICLPRAGGSDTGICPSASDVASRTQVRQTDRQTDRQTEFWRSAWQHAWRWQPHAAPCSRITYLPGNLPGT